MSQSHASTSTLRRSRVQADLILFSVAVIWGVAFVAQRVAALEVGILIFNGLRFSAGALVLLPMLWVSTRNGRSQPAPILSPAERRNNSLGVLLAGLILTCGAAFQQAGIQFTTAGNAGFVTGLYVVLIPLFLALGWRRKPRPALWGAAILAALGLYLLSTGGQLRLNLGDGLVFISAIFWALHVILIDWLVQRVDVLRISVGQFTFCAIFSFILGFIFEPVRIGAMVEYWWVIAYAGVISVGFGYTLQVVGQRTAPPADAAIILSLEAVFAALAGWVVLDENLALIQLIGCGIMFLGMLLAQSDVILAGRNAHDYPLEM